MRGRFMRGLAACFAVGLLFAPAASAHHDADSGGHLQQIAQDNGEPVLIHEHNYSRQQIQQVSETLFLGRIQGAGRSSGDALASAWCGTPRSTDDNTNHPNNGYDIKIVYAYAADQPNNFASYANLIQQTASATDSIMAQSSGSSRAIRYDVGTDCGVQYADIQTVKLPHNLAYYTGAADVGTAFFGDISQVLPTSTSTRNYLVFADRLGLGANAVNLGGQGMIQSDDRAGGNNLHNFGGRVAVLYGRGESTFYYDSWGINYTYTSALHEIGHTIGAVQNSAPHTSGAYHCNDGVDIMCYADGGPQSNYTTTRCATAVFDCGQDDYFNTGPSLGSYLQTHWNTFDSPFLCRPAYCNTVTAPPSNIQWEPYQGQIYATASTDGPGTSADLEWAWDRDGIYGYEETGFGPYFYVGPFEGTRTVRVRVKDLAGAYTDGTITVTNQAPIANLSRNNDGYEVAAGSTVHLNASGSRDPDGEITDQSWSVDGQVVSGATGQTLDRVFTTPGDHIVSFRAKDVWGTVATVSVNVPVKEANTPPEPHVVMDPANPKPGDTVTFWATGTDTDSNIVGPWVWTLPDRTTSTLLGTGWNYTFPTAGTYTFKLSMQDDLGATGTETLTVTVPENADPEEPTDPTDPADPTDPVEPTEPVEPTQPTQPANGPGGGGGGVSPTKPEDTTEQPPAAPEQAPAPQQPQPAPAPVVVTAPPAAPLPANVTLPKPRMNLDRIANGLPLTGIMTPGAKVTATATISSKVAKRLGLPTRLARVRTTARPDGSFDMILRLSRHQRRKLGRRASVVVTIQVADSAGKRKTVRIRLTR